MFGHLDESLMCGRNRWAKDGWGLKIQSSIGLKFLPNSSMSGDVTAQIIRAKEQVNPQAYPGNEEDKPQPSHRRHRELFHDQRPRGVWEARRPLSLAPRLTPSGRRGAEAASSEPIPIASLCADS
jgi:hypothetical protein